MRTLIDLPPEQLEALTNLGKAKGRSRAALVREAVAEYLGKHEAGSLDEAFGLWRNKTGDIEDGLAYQERLRAEWE